MNTRNEHDLSTFLLHPDRLVRDAVAEHLYQRWSEDQELVPLVLEAARRYGSGRCQRLFGFGERFPLSERSMAVVLVKLVGSEPGSGS